MIITLSCFVEEMTDFRFADGFKITSLKLSMDGEASRKAGRNIAFMYAVKRGRAIVRIFHISLNCIIFLSAIVNLCSTS